MNRIQRPFISLSIAIAAFAIGAGPLAAFAATQPRLGTAANFAVLAGSTITNTGQTRIRGGLGLSPGSAVTGFPPGVVTPATQHKSDAVAILAKTDLVTAYNDLASWGATRSMTGLDLGGKTLTPGVYTYSSSAQLTGTLTLKGNGIYIFQMGSTLTTASNSHVSLINGAQGCGVFWKVGSSATLGSGTSLVGTIIAMTSITLVNGASLLPGRALARNGAVTMDNNQITSPSGGCGAISSSTTTVTSPTTTTGTGTLAQTGGGPLQGSPLFTLMLMTGAALVLAGLSFAVHTQVSRRRT